MRLVRVRVRARRAEVAARPVCLREQRQTLVPRRAQLAAQRRNLPGVKDAACPISTG